MSYYLYERVWEIYNKLRPKPEDFLSPTRFFVREGKMSFKDEKKKKKKKRHFFLFNDVLLFCQKEGPGRYYLRIYITLRAQNVSLEEINIDYQFRLKTRQRSFILYATSSQSRKEWMQDIALSISGTHEEEVRQKYNITPSQTPEKKVPTSPDMVSKSETKLPEEYYKGDVIKDLKKKSGKSGKEKESSDSSSESSSDEGSDSSESPKRKNSSTRKSKPKVGDLLGLGSEITNLNLGSPRSVNPSLASPRPVNPSLASPQSAGSGINPNLANPRSAGSGPNVQAQAPVNPFFVGGTVSPSTSQSTNPFLANPQSPTLNAPAILPRSPVSGIISPGGTTVNPFQPNSRF